MFNKVNDEIFEAVTLRYLTTDPNEYDPRIVPILVEFNKIKGVVSLFSCSGHTEAERGEKVPRYQSAYILFAASKDSTAFFERYEKYLDTLTVEEYRKLRPTLSTSKRIPPPNLQNKINGLYNAWKLSIVVDFGADKTGEKTMAKFMEMIKVLGE